MSEPATPPPTNPPPPPPPASATADPSAASAASVGYRVTHVTTLRYAEAVPLSQHRVWLTPRDLPGRQACTDHAVQVDPPPRHYRTRTDAFGNVAGGFSLDVPHRRLTVTARSTVAVTTPDASAARYDASPAWEAVRDGVAGRWPWRTVRPFTAVSPRVTPDDAMTAYASLSFTPGRPVLRAAAELNRRLHADLNYRPGVTAVDTPPAEAFARREGVCQDFAHVMLAMLRGLGLPARYVSGYLRNERPPSADGGTVGDALVGADASHAWVGVYAGDGPGGGWVDFDPTNDKAADADHIVTAWGRDYADVTPLRGVIVGGGRQTVDVAVTVTPTT